MTEGEPLRLYFACVGNSGRSQMAEAFAEAMGGDAVEAASGGSVPADAVLDHVRTAMAEVGVPMLGREPSPIDPDAVREAHVIGTMGCSEDACPSFPGVEERDWDLDDPDGEPLERVREIRDEVARRVRELLKERGVLDEGPGWVEG